MTTTVYFGQSGFWLYAVKQLFCLVKPSQTCATSSNIMEHCCQTCAVSSNIKECCCGRYLIIMLIISFFLLYFYHSSVEGGIYVLRKAHDYVLHPVSQKFPQCRRWNGSSVHLVDTGPLLSFQGRLSSTSSFHPSLLRIDDVISLAL